LCRRLLRKWKLSTWNSKLYFSVVVCWSGRKYEVVDIVDLFAACCHTLKKRLVAECLLTIQLNVEDLWTENDYSVILQLVLLTVQISQVQMELTFPLIFHLSCLYDVFSSGLTLKLISIFRVEFRSAQRGNRFFPNIPFFFFLCRFDPMPYGASRSHSDTPYSVGLLWTSDQPDAATATWQHTKFRRSKHLCSRQDSNPKSQQASGRWPTP